jgi:hypothetical protein
VIQKNHSQNNSVILNLEDIKYYAGKYEDPWISILDKKASDTDVIKAIEDAKQMMI